MPSAEDKGEKPMRTEAQQQVRDGELQSGESGRRPPGFLPVLRGVLMVGLGRVVSARAAAAAECWAFLMLVPSASHCCSPSVSRTEKIWKEQRDKDERRFGDAAEKKGGARASVTPRRLVHLGVSWSLLRQQLVLWLDLIETG